VALTPDRSLTDEEKRAKRKAAQDDVLLREVDDAVRQDRYAEFGRRYGRPLIALGVLALVLSAALVFWQSRQNAARERESEALVSALDQLDAGNLDSALTSLSPLVADGDDAQRAAAGLLSGGIALEQGNARKAAELFEGVAADDDAPPAMRDLATIRAVAASYDTLAPDQVVARLKPLAAPGNPWFGSAGELVAMAYLDQGRNAEAGALFAAIAKDDEVPDTLKSRARQMAGLLGVDAIEDVDEVLEQQAAEAAPAAQ
jgi:hypothetical protein